MADRSHGEAGLRLKRLLDIILAASGLIATAPVMLILAIGIRVTMGSPILFRQSRPGLGGRPFVMLKFRTMSASPEDAPELDRARDLASKQARITPLGRWLRRTSLDELPELWNVLLGEMSVVGPRPLLMEYLPHYTQEQMRRHEVRPGITGLAQVGGRHRLEWEQRFSLDTWYVDHWSLRLDVRILRDTLRVLLAGQGDFAVDSEPPRFDAVASGYGQSEAPTVGMSPPGDSTPRPGGSEHSAQEAST